MKNDLIFAYYIMLSNHMWDDEQSPPRFYYAGTEYEDNIDTEEKTWDEIIDFIAENKYNTVVIDVGDGVKYDSHPEISAPNAWSKEKLKAKLSIIREKGMTPIPKLNFSTCHRTWLKKYRYMISTPEYYKVCADLIDEVCEIFGKPALFHLGLDEETADMQVFRDSAIIRGEKLWWHDAYYLFECCDKNGARPWVWSDYFWDNPTAFAANMPKKVLQSNWFYNNFKNYVKNPKNNDKLKTYNKLNDLGYEQIPTCSTWAVQKNPYQTLLYCKNELDPSLIKGYMTAGWFHTNEENIYSLKNDAYRLYLGRKIVYPETL